MEQKYISPTPEQVEIMSAMRAMVMEVIRNMQHHGGNPRHLANAIDRMDEALFWFNASVVRQENKHV